MNSLSTYIDKYIYIFSSTETEIQTWKLLSNSYKRYFHLIDCASGNKVSFVLFFDVETVGEVI